MEPVHFCYVTPAFSGGPLQKGAQTKVAHKRAEVLHQPYDLGGPQKRGQSQRWPTSGRKCYVTLVFSSGPLQKGTQTKVAHKWAEVLHQPYVLRGPQTRGQSQRWPTSGRNCYISPTISGGPLQRGTPKKIAHEWAEVLHQPCLLGGPQKKGTKPKVAHKWAEVLHQPYDLGGTQTRRQSQRWPTSVRKCYAIPAFSGVPKKGDKAKGGPQVGGSATSALQSRGYPNKETKSKVAHKCAEVLRQPCVLGRSPTEGDANKSGPQKSGSATSALRSRAVPKQGDKAKGGPQVGGSATSALQSRAVPYRGGRQKKLPTSGRKCYISPAFSGVPKKRGQSQRWPTSGRKCYISPTISGVPKQGDKVKGGPQVCGSATPSLPSRGSPKKETKPKVAHKWAEVLH